MSAFDNGIKTFLKSDVLIHLENCRGFQGKPMFLKVCAVLTVKIHGVLQPCRNQHKA